jgi:hypothetical protein
MRRKSAGADLLLTAAVPGASDAAARRLPAADIVAMLASALPSSIQ